MRKGPGKKTALVLGGGSARGLAHIGALKVIRRNKIPIDMVVGTSIGSLMGAIYALGLPLRDMEERALKTTWRDLADFAISRLGLLEGRNLERIIRDSINGRGFDNLKMPLAVVATDIENGEEVVVTSGDLTKAIKASCSIPGVFIPTRVNRRLLVDGGLKDSLPSSVAKAMGATFIIAVDVGFCVRKGRISNIFQALFQSIQIIGNELNKLQSKQADAVIKVPLGGDIDQLAFDRAAEIIKAGEKAAEEAMPALVSQMKKRGVF